MADFTTYKALELPKSNEKYNVSVANKNSMVIDSELHKLEMKNQSQDELLATKEELNEHINDRNNPHKLNKNDIGLNNIDNTSDLNKPVSLLQQDAINAAMMQSKQYTDIKIAELINDAPETLDTLKEVADTIKENETIVQALDAAIGTKVNQTDILKSIESINENTIEGKVADALVVKEVFQSVSNGKQLVASAITDKGIETEATNTFAVMAENIRNIQSNGFGSGIVSSAPYRIEFNGTLTRTKMSQVNWYIPFENIRKIKFKDVIVTGCYYNSSNPTFDVYIGIILNNNSIKTLKDVYISSTGLTRFVLDNEIDLDDENSTWYNTEDVSITGICVYGGISYNTTSDIYHVTFAGDIDIFYD